MATHTDTRPVLGRQEAIACGVARYFTGDPCPRGHVAERLAKSRACVDCRKDYSARYRKAHPARVKEKRDLHNRRYYAENKRKISEKGKTRREKLGDQINAKKRIHYKANRARFLAKAKEAYSRDREAAIARAISWAKANRDKRKSYENNRRAKKRRSGGSFSSDDIARILAAQRVKCAICRRSLKIAFHIDHIIAISKGGTNFPRNLQLLCPPCNMRKHNSDPIDYMQSLGYLL